MPKGKGKGGKGKGKGGKGYKGKGKGFANATYYWDENTQDYVQLISEGTEGTMADGDGDAAAVVPE